MASVGQAGFFSGLREWCDEARGSEEHPLRCKAAARMKKCYKTASPHLDLSLGLSSLPNVIGRLEAVTDLCLVYNAHATVPDSLRNLKKLRYICLFSSQLKELPDVFADMDRLQMIFVHNNQLRALPPSLMERAARQKVYIHAVQNPFSRNSVKRLKKLPLHPESKLNIQYYKNPSFLLELQQSVFRRSSWNGPNEPVVRREDLLADEYPVTRTGQPKGYPQRQAVPCEKIFWEVPFNNYAPPYYVAPSVANNPKAEPEDLSQLGNKVYQSLEVDEIFLDSNNRPLNPVGRTGLAGRGRLWKWGPNQAVDPLVTRLNPETKKLEVLLIERRDCGAWALPGGMIDEGETFWQALARELKEETKLHLTFENSPQVTAVYRGYVDDPRNTDNAWIETTAMHYHLTPEEALACKAQAGSDARAARWVTADEALGLLPLYANHKVFVETALKEADMQLCTPQQEEEEKKS